MAKRVFIGVGHGGADSGAVGRVVEKEANLTIALELKRLLEESGVTVGISRTRDENDDLMDEIRECNAFAPDLAVEVHNNSGGGDGFEVYIQTGGYAAESRAAAKAIEAQVIAIGQNSRGIKTRRNSLDTADYFGWLRLCKAPAVLLEGFFVDSNDAKDFDTPDKQRRLALAYAKGICNYLGITFQEGEIDMSKEELKKLIQEAIEADRKKRTYKTYSDVPGWGKEAVKAAMDKNALRGEGRDSAGNVILNISEDMVRTLVVLYRLGVL